VEALGAETDEVLCRTALVALGHGAHAGGEGLFRRMQGAGAAAGAQRERDDARALPGGQSGGAWGAVYRELRRAGGTPNAWTYCILISAMGRQGKAQRAASLFRAMQAQGLQPGRAEWQALILAHAGSGDAAAAKASLRAMLQAGFSFSNPAGNALLTAYCRAGLVQEAQQLARRHGGQGLHPAGGPAGPAGREAAQGPVQDGGAGQHLQAGGAKAGATRAAARSSRS